MAVPTLDQLVTEIDQWFVDTMHGSVVSRDVSVYNHVHEAYQQLKKRIAALVTGKPIAPQPQTPAEEASPAYEETPVDPPASKTKPPAA